MNLPANSILVRQIPSRARGATARKRKPEIGKPDASRRANELDLNIKRRMDRAIPMAAKRTGDTLDKGGQKGRGKPRQNENDLYSRYRSVR